MALVANIENAGAGHERNPCGVVERIAVGDGARDLRRGQRRHIHCAHSAAVRALREEEHAALAVVGSAGGAGQHDAGCTNAVRNAAGAIADQRCHGARRGSDTADDARGYFRDVVDAGSLTQRNADRVLEAGR